MPPADLTDRVIYHATYWPSFALATFGFGLRAAGRANVPPTGPALLVANHQSFIDPWLVGQAAPRRLKYLARHTLFTNPLFGRLITAYGAVPIDRGFGKEGLQAVLAQLRAGRAVVVFAEGERTRTGAMQPLKAGVALLLKKADCPVIPVGIAGAFAMWPRHQLLPAPEPLVLPADGRGLAVAFGRPLPAGRLQSLDRETVLGTVQAAMMDAVGVAERVRRKA